MIDASSLIYRAFFSTPETVRSPGGEPVNAAHGFINMLARLIGDRDPDYLVCAADADWRPQWRVDLLPSYKAHRLEMPETPQLDRQVPLIFELMEACGVAVAGCPEYEAEDVIGALVPRCRGRVEIVSGDRDLFQLVRDPDVAVLYPKKGVSELVRVDEAEIRERFGIPGRAYGDYALLRGDPSDGLPGVSGIGEKTAALLVTRYGNISAVIEAALTGNGTGPLGKVRGALDYLDRAAQVVLISGEAPVGEVEMKRPDGASSDEAIRLAEAWGLRNPVERLLKALGRRSAPNNR
ncbi:MAG: 5'-3' exonuclease [Actinomycetota bacterium]|nr:5'-3' exonuclease [Actinomycetota bacterium]